MASGESGEKKISFGFSKSVKKPALNKNAPPEKKVDYIECLDDKAIKVIGEEEKKDEPLIIPMLGSKTWHDRILNKVNADIFEPKAEIIINGGVNNVKIKEEDSSTDVVNAASNDPQPMEKVTVKSETPDEPKQTLEERAAEEILQDLKLQTENAEETKTIHVPLPEDDSLVGKKESSLEDYEQIPIDKFGEAMLRGMGWQPGKGIGKSEKIVAAVVPELRPRGMGLGADKLMIQKQIAAAKIAEEENLKIVKGTYVKITSGKQSGNYGQIEALDDDGGRLIIKLALGGNILSVNESMVQPVSKNEYDKNAKVLNSKKFDEYKNKKEKKEILESTVSSSSEQERTREKERNDKHKNRKKSKKNKRYSNDDNSDSDRRSRKRKNSSESDADYKRKKSKKTKKHKKRDISSERSSHKSKKKHKERDRESRDSSKKSKVRHKRSRSRSQKRR